MRRVDEEITDTGHERVQHHGGITNKVERPNDLVDLLQGLVDVVVSDTAKNLVCTLKDVLDSLSLQSDGCLGHRREHRCEDSREVR